MKNVMQDADYKRKKKRRPVCKPFNSDEIRKIGGEITSDGDFLIFEGNRYSHKGFLYKTFPLAAILTDGVTPTLAELEKFGEVPIEGIELEGLSASVVSSNAAGKAAGQTDAEKHNFATGDNVEVCEGELAHLQGKIVAIDGGKITIIPKHEDLKVHYFIHMATLTQSHGNWEIKPIPMATELTGENPIPMATGEKPPCAKIEYCCCAGPLGLPVYGVA
jgi:hypothetical protein